MRGYTGTYRDDVAMAHHLFGTPLDAVWPEVLLTSPRSLLLLLLDGIFFGDSLNVVEIWVRGAPVDG